MKKGLFITFYGISNIGKSTQVKILNERLQKLGYDTVTLKYPIYDLPPTGPIINDILRSGKPQTISEVELQTLYRDNRIDFQPKLTEMIDEGKIILAEDYTGTGISWGHAKGVAIEILEEMHSNVLKEDHAIVLVGERHFVAKESHHLHESNDQLVDKVGNVLLNLAKRYNWEVLRISDSIEDTSENLLNSVLNIINKHNANN